MEVEVEDGRAIGGTPDGSVSPYGAYLCPKGLASVDFLIGAENRLFASIKRCHDEFVPIGSDTAIAEIGDELAALRCRLPWHGGLPQRAGRVDGARLGLRARYPKFLFDHDHRSISQVGDDGPHGGDGQRSACDAR